MAAETVTFELADDTSRLELNVQETDEPILVEGTFVTGDPAVIRALDEHPAVRRAAKAGKEKGA